MKKINFGELLSNLKKRWKLILGLVIVVGLIVVFYARSKANGEVILTFTNPQRESITKMLEVSGHVNAKEKARLRFIAGGKVVYIGAKEG